MSNQEKFHILVSTDIIVQLFLQSQEVLNATTELVLSSEQLEGSSTETGIRTIWDL